MYVHVCTCTEFDECYRLNGNKLVIRVLDTDTLTLILALADRRVEREREREIRYIHCKNGTILLPLPLEGILASLITISYGPWQDQVISQLLHRRIIIINTEVPYPKQEDQCTNYVCFSPKREKKSSHICTHEQLTPLP